MTSHLDGERADPVGPGVSVIIATYNWSSVLRHALQSVLWQSFQNFEVLIIGDGCTDDSAAVVASLDDRRLSWHNLTVNSGNQSAPNNAGLRMARGRYVAYLGHDDLWYPTHLSALVDTIERSGADLVYGLTVMIGLPGTGGRIVTGIPPAENDRPLFVPPSSILHRRELIDEIGPWRDYRTIRLPPDRDFLERAWAYRRGFAASERLTVFKFPSSWRPNSYRDRRCDEQAEYVRRIGTEPDFLTDELLAIARAYAARTTAHDLTATEDPRPGWTVELNRWIRGLEADPPPSAVEELFRLRARETELVALVEQQTAWAQGLGAEVAARDDTIRALQAQVAEQTAWAQELSGQVAHRDAMIRALQAQAAEQTAWAQKLGGEVAPRDAMIRTLQAQVAEQTAWAKKLGGEVAPRDAMIRALQAQVAEQTAWAQGLVRELAARDVLIQELQELHEPPAEERAGGPPLGGPADPGPGP